MEGLRRWASVDFADRPGRRLRSITKGKEGIRLKSIRGIERRGSRHSCEHLPGNNSRRNRSSARTERPKWRKCGKRTGGGNEEGFGHGAVGLTASGLSRPSLIWVPIPNSVPRRRWPIQPRQKYRQPAEKRPDRAVFG